MPEETVLLGPDDLIRNSLALLQTGRPCFARAAFLETVVAFEVHIAQTIFPLLEAKHGKAIADCLERNTRFRFDDRLHDLLPEVTGILIDRTAAFWKDYRKIREERNRIVHGGGDVTLPQARKAVDAVHRCLCFTGRTIGLELALLILKRTIEDADRPMASEHDMAAIVSHYFSGLVAPGVPSMGHLVDLKADNGESLDLVLRYGDDIVAFELAHYQNQKAVHRRVEYFQKMLSKEGMGRTRFDQAVLLVSIAEDLPADLDEVQQLADGRLYLLGVRVPRVARKRV